MVYKSLKHYCKEMINKQTFFYVFFLFIISTFPIFGQQMGKVHYYTFTEHTIDTTGIRTYLLFDNEKSLFIWKSIKYKQDEELSRGNEQIAIQRKKIYRDTIGKRYFNKYNQTDLFLRETHLDKSFFVRDSKNISWKITEEKKDIGSFMCIKAETTFRGRKFIAWFTPEIPIPSGPWKLEGLPGLILEAYSEDYKVNFLFRKINYPLKDNKEKIVLSDFGDERNIITLKEYVLEVDRINEEEFNKQLSKLPKDINIIQRKKERMGIEKKYEWEYKR